MTIKDNRVVTVFILSDDNIGTPQERVDHQELINRLIKIIDSKKLGYWDDTTILEGSYISRFICDNPNKVAKAFKKEIKKFKPRKGSMVQKHYNTKTVDTDWY